MKSNLPFVITILILISAGVVFMNEFFISTALVYTVITK